MNNYRYISARNQKNFSRKNFLLKFFIFYYNKDMSLYTKYRPKDWDSLIGQDLIKTILASSLKNNSTSHAYIFTGSRWTGKTTSARILAKALNCTNLQNWNPCHNCENCIAFENNNLLDIIEIDAASNTGVDNVRELIDDAKFEPIQWKYKIYIIDEVHMLSTGAFNALLKTMEEPPKHIKFILATTEIHKVPETIQSRAHRFDFNKINEKDIFERLKFVCESENIEFEENALKILAKTARWALRDWLKLLEQFSINNVVKEEDIKKSLSILDENFLEEIIEILKNKNTEKLNQILNELKNKNIDAQNFFDQILLKLKDKMFENLNNENFEKYNHIMWIFIDLYDSIKKILNNSLIIEIALIRSISQNTTKNKIEIFENFDQKNEIKISQNTNFETKNINNFKNEEKIITKTESEKNIFVKPIEDKKIEEIPQKQETNQNFSAFNFLKLVSELQKTNPSISATIKKASFKQNENILELSFKSNWDINLMNDSKYQTPTIEALNKLFWWEWQIIIKQNSDFGMDVSMADDVF